MILARKPLSPTARLVAGLLAAVCLTGGALGVVLAIMRRRAALGLLALPLLALGALYAGAAWRGRPWSSS